MSGTYKHNWRGRLLRTDGNRPFIAWLRDRGSLTARIQTKGRFAVRVLRQGLGVPTTDEAVMLEIEPGVRAWIREVALLCDGRIVVFAHTVLPCHPGGPLTVWLARLGSRSLGALLFSHAGFKRGPMHFNHLDPRHALFQPAVAALQLGDGAPDTLWARRSHFSFGFQSVLVTEVFSPQILQLDASDHDEHQKKVRRDAN